MLVFIIGVILTLVILHLHPQHMEEILFGIWVAIALIYMALSVHYETGLEDYRKHWKERE